MFTSSVYEQQVSICMIHVRANRLLPRVLCASVSLWVRRSPLQSILRLLVVAHGPPPQTERRANLPNSGL